MTTLGLLVILGVAAMLGWRLLDRLADQREMKRLVNLQPQTPAFFSAAMVAQLPDPARRYFRFAIAEGTPLLTVADLKMFGQFSLGSKDRPNYMPMRAHQVLAPLGGFVWKMAGRSGHLSVSGSDSARWTRFWLGGIVPVARLGGDTDHARAAFGRYVAEAVFWVPAALLPRPDVTWQEVNANTSRVTLRRGALVQSVDVTVAEDGRPTQVVFLRWSNANPEKIFQFQPFGGYLSNFQKVQGFRVPLHVEAGNFFGTDAYFPFFIVDVDEITFPPAD